MCNNLKNRKTGLGEEPKQMVPNFRFLALVTHLNEACNIHKSRLDCNYRQGQAVTNAAMCILVVTYFIIYARLGLWDVYMGLKQGRSVT